MIEGTNHFTITAESRERTLDYYCGLLGLREGFRPDLGFPGAWLYAPDSDHAIVHIYWDRPMPEPRTGVIDHLAFSARGLRAVKARFDEQGVAYDLRRQAGSGIWQLFSVDPNGARVELDFDSSETLET
jgi:catechol 2,3-dioxygenase-like lactoylglutathione lyase family enzyme